jgi:hypothetical protein
MLYLDESGNHDLRPEKINPRYPVFALGGVVVDRAYERIVIAPQMRDFKIQYLGDDEIILHNVDMHRARNGFEPLSDPAFRLEFYRALNALINSWVFKIIACTIKLNEHIAQYKDHALDPYMYSLDVIVERFCKELADKTAASSVRNCATLVLTGIYGKRGKRSGEKEQASLLLPKSMRKSCILLSRISDPISPGCSLQI